MVSTVQVEVKSRQNPGSETLTLLTDQSPPWWLIEQDGECASCHGPALYQRVECMREPTPSPQSQPHRGGAGGSRWASSPVPCWSIRWEPTELWDGRRLSVESSRLK